MRKALVAVLAAALFVSGGAAFAATKVKQTTKTYSVGGRSGEALIAEMDRRGPKHGFMTRAIAQTRYAVGWNFTWEKSGGTCRLLKSDGSLDLQYTYPKLKAGAPAGLRKRWDRFLVGVYAHEETHGRLAREMVRAADKSLTGLTVRRDPNCARAMSEAKRRIDKVYNAYEARQVAFDRKEHREGGNVERLLRALIAGD